MKKWQINLDRMQCKQILSYLSAYADLPLLNSFHEEVLRNEKEEFEREIYLENLLVSNVISTDASEGIKS